MELNIIVEAQLMVSLDAINKFYNKNAILKSIQQIFEETDYTSFNETYKLRYKNYLNFLSLNNISST